MFLGRVDAGFFFLVAEPSSDLNRLDFLVRSESWDELSVEFFEGFA
jgi:hypothetical protein